MTSSKTDTDTLAGPTLVDLAQSVSTTHPPESPIIAGRYRVLGLLGDGGMGVVYRALDMELDEVVALKRLRRGWLDSETALDRFRQEVRLARRVTHRNVARTYDIGEHGDEKFLTMEYVDGTSLSRRINEEGPLPIDEALRIATGIAEALEAAHAAEVVHRDLKPDNVLLCSDGRVVVTDFGIARATAGDSNITTGGGLLVGTPSYMAPEQVEGGELDGRTDLYALGLLLYEMLTARQAFKGESALGTAAARLTHPPPDPRELRPQLPESLGRMVDWLLQRDREDRPENATQVIDALGAVNAPASTEELRRPSVRPIAYDRTLALKPLANRSAPADDWLADGLTDELLDNLCVVRGLRIKARSDSGDRGESAVQFGERMGVQLVVDGSVRTVGDAVRIRLRLTSVEDGFQIWAGQFQCPVGDLLIVSDQATRELALAAGLHAPARKRDERDDPEAVEMYLRAFQNQDRFQGDPIAWLDLLVQARDRSPNNARIVSAYAVGHAVVGLQPGVDAAALLDRAREAAERALELAPHLAEPWVAIARVRFASNNAAGAVRALGRALQNGPSVAAANDLLGRIFAEIDHTIEAQEFLRRALWLDDSLNFARVDLARLAALYGDWDQATTLCGDTHLRSPSVYGTIAPRLSLWAGKPIGPTATMPPHTYASTLLGLYQETLAGAPLDEVRRKTLLEARTALDPQTRLGRMVGQFAAELHAYAGDLDGALMWLEQSVKDGLEDLAWIRHCPLLDPLRKHRRFERALHTVESRASAIWQAWETAWGARAFFVADTTRTGSGRH